MKFVVTEELSTLLKMLRMQNHISAKELAEHIDRSPSYISKLEKGDVKAIQEENLTNILKFVLQSKDFYGEVLPGAVRVLQSFMKPERLLNQIWLMQYDVVERRVSVPEKMADDMLSHLTEKDLSVDEMVRVMDANLDSELSEAFQSNEMLSIDYGEKSRLLIRMDFSEEEIGRILNKEDKETGYLCLYSMVHTMFRMLNYPGQKTKLPPKDAVTVLRLAGTYMEQWGIFSLTGFGNLLYSEDFIRNQTPLATAGIAVADRISERIREMADHDMLLTTRQLNVFYDTLNWDAAFAMKILELPFPELGEMSFQNKKKLLEELQALVERYSQMSQFEKKMEVY